MKSNEKIYLHSPGVACSLGDDVASVNAALFAKCPENSFFTLTDQYSSGRNLPLGLVNSELPRVSIAGENTRNNRLLTKAVEPMVAEIERYKAHYGAHRCAAIVGTSTSGIADGEVAVRHFLNDGKLPANYDYAMQEVSAPSRYLANYLGFRGPSWTVSSACTSGGKALTSAVLLA